MTNRNLMSDEPLRYCCIGPRSGWCGKVHLTFSAAVKCMVRERRAWRLVRGRPAWDRVLRRLHSRAMPSGPRLDWLRARSGSTFPPGPLSQITIDERVRVPRGVMPDGY